ncbi:MAG: tRNA pseudouridine(55) synthase TruB [Planctomycetota bacterium]
MGRGSMSVTGMVVVDKPLGSTSRQAIDVVRRRLKTREIGHAGTLDPLASGVLVALVGRAKRLQELVVSSKKVYRAKVVLGAVSRTDDAEGPISETLPERWPDREAIDGALPRFVGLVRQRPPAFSAIHVGGRRAYEMARQGEEVEIPEREVEIVGIEVVAYDPPALTLLVTCSGGTYIRSLARDLGEALGVGGYLGGLCRERVGPFELGSAVSPDAIVWQDIQPLEAVIPRLPGAVRVDLDEGHRERLERGGPIPVSAIEGEAGVFAGEAQVFAAIGGRIVARVRLDSGGGTFQSAGLLTSEELRS